MSEARRNTGIDASKSALIVLVVLGHALQYGGGMTESWLFRFIYSFHMAAFMMISGYVGFDKPMNGSALVRKVRRLLVPFFAWWLLGTLCFEVPQDGWCCVLPSFVGLILNPATGLWFFWDLAILIALLFAVQVVAARTRIAEIFWAGSIWFVLFGVTKVCGMTQADALSIVRYMPFFFIGYFFSHYKVMGRLNRYAVVLILPLFLGLECAYLFLPVVPGLRFTLSLLGSLFVLLVGVRWTCGIGGSLVASLGCKTLGVYAIHMTFCRYLPEIVHRGG